MTALSERHQEAAAKLEQLRKQRGAAALDGVPFDSLSIDELEHEIDALHEAGDVAVARQREAEAASRRDQRALLVEDLKTREAARLEAVAAIEQGARDLVAALNETLQCAADQRRILGQLGKSGLSMPVDAANMSVRLGERLSAIFAGIQRSNYLQVIASASHATWRKFDDNWRELERAEMAGTIDAVTQDK